MPGNRWISQLYYLVLEGKITFVSVARESLIYR